MTAITRTIDASCAQSTLAGSMLEELFYGGLLNKLLLKGEFTGCPHNGGLHRLRLKLQERDIEALLELIVEVYGASRRFGNAALIFARRVRLRMMGGSAPIMEVLAVFTEGPNHDWALRDMQAIKAGLESEGIAFTTLADMTVLDSSTISGPQSRYTGNRSKSWMGWVMSTFGLQHRLSGY